MPKVGVIIPAYNAAKYLPLALDSVAAQTFSDWQILLVDDGSKDNTPHVVQPYIDRFGPKLNYIRQENRGLPGARNTAIRESDTELLALLDADDIWLPNRLEDSVPAFDNQQVGLSYGLVSGIDGEGQYRGKFEGNPDHAEGCIAPYIYMRMVELPCPTMTFRRSAVEKVGMFDEAMRATEDRDLWLRIALHYEVKFIPKVLAKYRAMASSMSTDPERMLRAQRLFLDKNYGSEGCGMLERRIGLSRCYKQRADALGERGRPWSALRSALHAVALYPMAGTNVRTAGSWLLKSLQLRRSQQQKT